MFSERVPGGSWEGARWFLGGCQLVLGRVPLGCQGVLEGAIGVPSGSWEGAKCLLGGCQVIPKRVL